MQDPPWTSPALAILDPHSHLAPTPFINQRDAADLVIVLDIIHVIILVVIFAITAKVIFVTTLSDSLFSIISSRKALLFCLCCKDIHLTLWRLQSIKSEVAISALV